MRRFAALIVSVSVLALSLVMFTFPASAASTTCYRATVTFTNNNEGQIGSPGGGDVVAYAGWSLHTQNDQFIDFIIPEEVMVRHGSPKTVIYEASFDSTLKVTYLFEHAVFFTDGTSASDDTDFSASVSPCGGAGAPAGIHDGRINATDLAAPAAIYCASGASLDIWDINGQGQGSFGIHVSKADIDAALAKAKSLTQNTLIAQWGDKTLYALTSGQIMLVGHDLKEPGKGYQVVFPASICS